MGVLISSPKCICNSNCEKNWGCFSFHKGTKIFLESHFIGFFKILSNFCLLKDLEYRVVGSRNTCFYSGNQKFCIKYKVPVSKVNSNLYNMVCLLKSISTLKSFWSHSNVQFQICNAYLGRIPHYCQCKSLQDKRRPWFEQAKCLLQYTPVRACRDCLSYMDFGIFLQYKHAQIGNQHQFYIRDLQLSQLKKGQKDRIQYRYQILIGKPNI